MEKRPHPTIKPILEICLGFQDAWLHLLVNFGHRTFFAIMPPLVSIQEG